MPVSAIGLKNEVMTMPSSRASVDAGRGGLGVPDVQRRGVEAAGDDLVDVLRHHGRVRLAIEDDDLGAVLLLRVALGLGRLGLVEDVRQIGHEERDPLGLRLSRGGDAGCGQHHRGHAARS